MHATEKLSIAIEAPPWFEIPPAGYGGIEWICFWLAEGLVARGHDVTLIAAGASHTGANFVRSYERPPSERLGDPVPEVLHAAVVARALEGLDVDVVHSHTLAGPLLAPGREVPTLATAHGPMTGELGDYFRWLSPYLSLVAISKSQRRDAPGLPWVGTVYNGIPIGDYPYREDKDDYLLFLGRMNPEKGVHLAIDAARGAGLPIVVAGKCNEAREHDYFAREIAPRLGDDVHWVGPVGGSGKMDLLARARCLVNPVQWAEPFGIVMVEALACGTPVVAIRNGSVEEVVDHGTTGYVVDEVADLPSAIGQAERIDPAACRARAERFFDTDRMVEGYEQVYRRLVRTRSRRKAVVGLAPWFEGFAASSEPVLTERAEGAVAGRLVGSQALEGRGTKLAGGGQLPELHLGDKFRSHPGRIPDLLADLRSGRRRERGLVLYKPPESPVEIGQCTFVEPGPDRPDVA
jgi:glycosyltransferase involved in cell wall biosynthesis